MNSKEQEGRLPGIKKSRNKKRETQGRPQEELEISYRQSKGSGNRARNEIGKRTKRRHVEEEKSKNGSLGRRPYERPE